MQLVDLIKNFEEIPARIWICPIIKRYCDHECYNYSPKTIAFLYKEKKWIHSKVLTSKWSPAFEDRFNAFIWARSLTEPIVVSDTSIYKGGCKFFDSFENLSFDLGGQYA